MKADCFYARVHVFFLVEKVSCGIKVTWSKHRELSAMFTRPRSKKKWASVADRFKSFAPFRLMGDSKNYVRSF